MENIFRFNYPDLAFLSFFNLWLQHFIIHVKCTLGNYLLLIKLVKIVHKYPACLAESKFKKKKKKSTLKYSVASGNKYVQSTHN